MSESAINHKQLDYLLKVGYNTRYPLYLRGGIGIGKSTHVEKFAREVAEKNGFVYQKWNALPRNGYDPIQIDAQGNPVMGTDGKPLRAVDAEGVMLPHVVGKDDVMRNPAPYMVFVDMRAVTMDLGDLKLPKYSEVDPTAFITCIPEEFQYLTHPLANAILFLDELNLAPPSVQGMLYSVINDREIGAHRLGDNVYVLAAGNNQKDRAAIYEMPMPLRNRFINCNLETPTIDDWTAWAVDKGTVNMHVVSFLRFKPDFLYRPGENGDFAFATPRSWERLSDAIQGIGTKKDDLLNITLIANALIGDAIATEFIEHMRMTNKVSLEEALKNPQIVKQYAKEPSIMCSIAGGLVERYRGDHKLLKQIAAVYQELPDEIGMWGFKMIKELAKAKFFPEIQNAMDPKVFAARYSKYLLDN